jgi:dTDP-4-amino-4,6-dideoxygalactose transaminase
MFPAADAAYQALITLPLYTVMPDAAIERVASVLREIL